ncbi:recombinase family protein [Roseovarius aquimarinus]|uniref:Recombinase family protein n=1 Tax=Roseovarius aquimarinus TaxID=1229156 RepID=A0ABW7I7Q5_9RHOB
MKVSSAKLGAKSINLPCSPSMGATGDQVCSQANQRSLVKESVMFSKKYIAYYRVSTVRQGASGLGLDAQRNATSNFIQNTGGELLNEFTEVESGKVKNRPELGAAIEVCRQVGATLLIAKLDRLARNVAFIANLIESGVKFTAIDMPNADRFMLHVYAAMGEEEGRRISERTKAALASAKARGVKLGVNGKNLATDHKQKADDFALRYGPKISQLRSERRLSFRAIAIALNDEHLVPNRHGGKWHQSSVHRLHTRFLRLQADGTQENSHSYRQATAP